MPPSAARPASAPMGRDHNADDLLAAANAIVAEKGLGGLTLRPLAQRLDISVSAISSRYGQKDEVLAAVCAAAMEADGAMLSAWRQRLPGVRTLSADAVADLVDTVLDDLLRDGRANSLLLCEVVQSAAWQPELRPALAAWLAQRAAFWDFVAGLHGGPLRYDLGAALHAYAIDETAHGLALDTEPAYRWLRKLGVRRLCAGFLDGEARWDAGSFDAVHAELGMGLDAASLEAAGSGARYRVDRRSDMVDAVGPHIADLILSGGSDAVTHRAVGKRADLAATTLVYHFPRQIDLLKAGLESLIASLQSGVDRHVQGNGSPDVASDMANGTGIAVATFAIALAATRFPELKPFAADMRRRRGENGLLVLRRQSNAPERIDMLAAQALAVTGLGDVLLRHALGIDGPALLSDVLLALVKDPPTP